MVSVKILTIFKSEGDIWKLLSALAAADFTTLATTLAAGIGVNLSIASASSTFLPRTISTSGRTLRGDIPVSLATALTSILLLLSLSYLRSLFCPRGVASEGSS